MRKVFSLLSLISVLSISSCAQTSFGFNAGAALASYKSKMGSESASVDSKIGFLAGVVVDVPLSEKFSFQPALDFVQKGAKESQNVGGYDYTAKTTLNYIEIPLNVLFKTGSEKG